MDGIQFSAAREILRQTFGFQAFRPGQDAIVEATLAGRDILAIMPTGGGKSLCYQLPAVLRTGVTLVVSPLIALMRDQIAQLEAYGVAAASLNSTLTPEDARSVHRRLRAGEIKLLYLAPERLGRPDTLDFLRGAGVSLLAVDEAHCVSQWGHDFRPDYLRLGALREALGDVQTIALTATADEATRSDIVSRLFARPPQVFVQGFDRPNIALAMQPKAAPRRQLLAFLERRRGRSGIIYCASRKRCEDLATALSGAGITALPYHAGLEKEVRERNQDRFLHEDGVVMVATVAFGMGIDKPDVRFVCHADLPKTIESYYQEIGRAGRDGLSAETLTLYGLEDIRLRRLQIDESDLSAERKRVEHQRLSALIALCEAPRCRRQTLLAYFGESAKPCGHCDLCLDGVELFDGTIEAQKAMSAILRTGQRFGTEHLIALLRGEETPRIQRHGHARLPTFGVGQDRSRNAWRSIFRQIYAAGLIAMEIGDYGGWSVTEAGRKVLRGEERIELRRDLVAATGRGNRTTARRPALNLDESLSANDRQLFDALRRERSDLAQAAGVPAYVVFSDRTLIEMAQAKPRSLDQLRQVHGVGQRKLERYGPAFLKVVAAEA